MKSPKAQGITEGVFPALDTRICELIPYTRVVSKSTPQQVADFIHGYAAIFSQEKFLSHMANR